MLIISYITYFIIIFGTINLIRLAILLIGSNIYELQHHVRRKINRKDLYLPQFSVIIPAYNEEKNILHTLDSVFSSNYLQERFEIIVVNDGSTDTTLSLLQKYKAKHPDRNLTIVDQKNTGKAHALNNAIKNYAKGEIIMCLDADSILAPDAIYNASQHFIDPKITALAANVKIIKGKGILNLAQSFEYLVGHYLKRAQTTYNIEYIIGGVGSTFRKDALEIVGYYDTNTMTEDIDLTLKIVRLGGKNFRTIFGSDVIAYTEAVPNLKGLIKQRYRWKYGRCQAFFKNKDLFFSNNSSYNKSLTYIYLPYAVVSDFAFLFEPIILAYLIYLTLHFHNIFTLTSAYSVFMSYLLINILSEDTLSTKEKIEYILISPPMYIYFYLLSFAEYVALIKSIYHLKDLRKSIKEGTSTWEHVDRLGVT